MVKTLLLILLAGVCGVAYASKCQLDRANALLEAAGPPRIADYPVPVCSANGDYEQKQCSYGGCWCVDAETGETVPGSSHNPNDGNFDCPPSKCQLARANALLVAAGPPEIADYPVPVCSANGYYEQKQCGFGGCRCVDAETGETVLGSPQLPNNGIVDCPPSLCQVKRAEAQLKAAGPPPIPDYRVPVCAANGDFVKRQCDAIGCYCVNPKTGEQLFGEPHYTNDECPLTTCELERAAAEQAAAGTPDTPPIADVPIPVCTVNGEYETKQCFMMGCRCVDSMTGESLYGEDFVIPVGEMYDCENAPTGCIVALFEALLDENPDYIPRCNRKDNWHRKQCSESQCWCADKQGVRITDKVPKESSGTLQCRKARRAA